LEAVDFYEIGLQARKFKLHSLTVEFWNKALEIGRKATSFESSLMEKIQVSLDEAIQEVNRP
jgi:hypothetical protein